MTRRLMTIALFSILPIISACGDETETVPPLDGIYEVTSHTISSEGCDNGQPPEDLENCFECSINTTFFKLKTQSFFGQSLLTMFPCTSATECDDDGDDPNTINLGGPIFERLEGTAQVGESSSAFSSGGSCTYELRTYKVDRNADGGVTFTREDNRLVSELESDPCLDQTDNPPARDTLTCNLSETIEATKL